MDIKRFAAIILLAGFACLITSIVYYESQSRIHKDYFQETYKRTGDYRGSDLRKTQQNAKEGMEEAKLLIGISGVVSFLGIALLLSAKRGNSDAA